MTRKPDWEFPIGLLSFDDHLVAKLSKRLQELGCRVLLYTKVNDLIEEISKNQIAVVVGDLDIGSIDMIDFLKLCKRTKSDTAVIMVGSRFPIDGAVENARSKAHEFVTKPFDIDQMVALIDKALNPARLRREARSVKQFRVGKRDSDIFIVGKSEIMQRISDLIEKVASSKASTVLIQGESGTGKGLIARAIHKKGSSSERPFIEITCSSLPETLLESELFGYEKGAFTDAKSSKVGLVELAQGGTLFLDEIGELPLNLQAKLLRLIETKCFRRIGGVKDIEVDTRVIAATNCDLKAAMEHGKFREDLYFRLMVIPIYVPPLRERKEDIPILASHFIDYFNEELKKSVRGVSDEAKEAMLAYHWPGNVRELRNTIERAILLESTDLILPEHLPREITESLGEKLPSIERSSSLFGTVPITLAEAEKIAIRNALMLAHGNKSKAARMLGISRQTLRNKIRALGLDKI